MFELIRKAVVLVRMCPTLDFELRGETRSAKMVHDVGISWIVETELLKL